MFSKEEKLKIITDMLQQHKTLSPQLFDDNLVLLPSVKSKLMYVADYMQDMYLPCFPNTRVVDFMLVGSSCGYNYNPGGDLDFFVIIDKIFPDKPDLDYNILGKIALVLNKNEWKPTIYSHKLDIAIMEEDNIKSKCHNNYSVLRGEWNSAPVYKEFDFTAEELHEEFLKAVEKVNRYVETLEKDKQMYLTLDGCELLQDYLQKIRDAAYNYDIEYEYSVEYNVYRLFKRLKVISHFNKYITESLKRLIRTKGGKND